MEHLKIVVVILISVIAAAFIIVVVKEDRKRQRKNRLLVSVKNPQQYPLVSVLFLVVVIMSFIYATTAAFMGYAKSQMLFIGACILLGVFILYEILQKTGRPHSSPTIIIRDEVLNVYREFCKQWKLPDEFGLSIPRKVVWSDLHKCEENRHSGNVLYLTGTLFVAPFFLYFLTENSAWFVISVASAILPFVLIVPDTKKEFAKNRAVKLLRNGTPVPVVVLTDTPVPVTKNTLHHCITCYYEFDSVGYYYTSILSYDAYCGIASNQSDRDVIGLFLTGFVDTEYPDQIEVYEFSEVSISLPII